MGEHNTVTVHHPTQGAIEIDIQIAPLIAALWQRGIETTNSCQENKPGMMWVEFATADDALRFIQLAASSRAVERGLYGRVMGMGWSKNWEYGITIQDDSVSTNANGKVDYHGSPRYRLSVAVRFPMSDYDAILASVTAT